MPHPRHGTEHPQDRLTLQQLEEERRRRAARRLRSDQLEAEGDEVERLLVPEPDPPADERRAVVTALVEGEVKAEIPFVAAAQNLGEAAAGHEVALAGSPALREKLTPAERGVRAVLGTAQAVLDASGLGEARAVADHALHAVGTEAFPVDAVLAAPGGVHAVRSVEALAEVREHGAVEDEARHAAAREAVRAEARRRVARRRAEQAAATETSQRARRRAA